MLVLFFHIPSTINNASICSRTVCCYEQLQCDAVLLRTSWRRDVVWLHRCILARRSTSLISSDLQCCRLKVVRCRSLNCWMISTVRLMTQFLAATYTRSALLHALLAYVLHKLHLNNDRLFISIVKCVLVCCDAMYMQLKLRLCHLFIPLYKMPAYWIALCLLISVFMSVWSLAYLKNHISKCNYIFCICCLWPGRSLHRYVCHNKQN